MFNNERNRENVDKRHLEVQCVIFKEDLTMSSEVN